MKRILRVDVELDTDEVEEMRACSWAEIGDRFASYRGQILRREIVEPERYTELTLRYPAKITRFTVREGDEVGVSFPNGIGDGWTITAMREVSVYPDAKGEA